MSETTDLTRNELDELKFYRAAFELVEAQLAHSRQQVRILQQQVVRYGLVPEVIG